jgi:hypothetical protein
MGSISDPVHETKGESVGSPARVVVLDNDVRGRDPSRFGKERRAVRHVVEHVNHHDHIELAVVVWQTFSVIELDRDTG